MSGTVQLTVTALDGIPDVEPGADLAALLIAAIERQQLAPRRHDVLVVTQKIVSKAEGRYLDLARLEPSARARQLAEITGKDARLVEAVLSQADEVLRAKRNVLIVATRAGLVIANAGIDQSNLAARCCCPRMPMPAPNASGNVSRRISNATWGS